MIDLGAQACVWDEKTRPSLIRAGVLGHPIGHSRSPLLHRHWMGRYGVQGSYEALDTPLEDLGSRLNSLREQGFAGFNVTLPLKEAIIPFCSHLDETARRIGAVNTVKIERDGSFSGYNTDSFGFIEHLRQSIPDFAWSGMWVLVLGAGGAARGVVDGLLSQGVGHIALVNRGFARAHELRQACADPARVHVYPWRAESGSESPFASSSQAHSQETLCDLSPYGLVVNTTSLGMCGQPPLVFSLETLPSRAVVYDIVYTPLISDFLQGARARGHRIVGGLGMLLHQARRRSHLPRQRCRRPWDRRGGA